MTVSWLCPRKMSRQGVPLTSFRGSCHGCARGLCPRIVPWDLGRQAPRHCPRQPPPRGDIRGNIRDKPRRKFRGITDDKTGGTFLPPRQYPRHTAATSEATRLVSSVADSVFQVLLRCRGKCRDKCCDSRRDKTCGTGRDKCRVSAALRVMGQLEVFEPTFFISKSCQVPGMKQAGLGLASSRD